MGCPRTGMPGRVPAPCDACGGGVGRGGAGGGAVYTGRGPVCGTIMRRPGVWARSGTPGVGRCGAGGGGATVFGNSTFGSSGVEAAVSCVGDSGETGAFTSGASGAVVTGASTRGPATSAGGGGAGWIAAGGGAACTGGAGGAGGRTGGAGRCAATDCGVMKRGFGGSAAGASAAGRGGCAKTAGFCAGGCGGRASCVTGLGGFTAGRGGGGGGVGGEGFCVSALSTSPGFEIFERSIFGLNSSSVALRRRGESSVPCSWIYLRTSTASWSSMELEWVFFSVTPTFGSASRIALLFTSSSRAKSLIRIFIPPLIPPYCLTKPR